MFCLFAALELLLGLVSGTKLSSVNIDPEYRCCRVCTHILPTWQAVKQGTNSSSMSFRCQLNQVVSLFYHDIHHGLCVEQQGHMHPCS